MLGKRSYMLNWDCQTGLWQVRSSAGYVVHESTSRHEVSAMCTRLNRQFPSRRTHPQGPLPRTRRSRRAGALLDQLLAFPRPVYG